MNLLAVSQPRWFAFRKLLSAGVWLLLPILTLLAFRSSPWQGYFRARPFNDSYDAMFIATTAGIGLTSIWAWSTRGKRMRNGEQLVLLRDCSWRNAFDLFELLACACLAILNFAASVPGSGIFWSTAFFCLLVSTALLAQAQKDVVFETPPRRTILGWIVSVILVALAILFALFPVLQPWSGPPEPFVRWRPFSLPGELIWRGVFLSYAFGMLLTAMEPQGRHRLFLVLLVLSGYSHCSEMAMDNMLSARMGGMNGNPEHLYGDVLGWFVIASVALLFLVLDRGTERKTFNK
jgi:hypothetical protein